MEWLIKMLMAHKRLRGLSEAQLKDLIAACKDQESLRLLEEHLQAGDFKFPHLEEQAPQLIMLCKAKAVLLAHYVGEIL